MSTQPLSTAEHGASDAEVLDVFVLKRRYRAHFLDIQSSASKRGGGLAIFGVVSQCGSILGVIGEGFENEFAHTNIGKAWSNTIYLINEDLLGSTQQGSVRKAYVEV